MCVNRPLIKATNEASQLPDGNFTRFQHQDQWRPLEPSAPHSHCSPSTIVVVRLGLGSPRLCLIVIKPFIVCSLCCKSQSIAESHLKTWRVPPPIVDVSPLFRHCRQCDQQRWTRITSHHEEKRLISNCVGLFSFFKQHSHFIESVWHKREVIKKYDQESLIQTERVTMSIWLLFV